MSFKKWWESEERDADWYLPIIAKAAWNAGAKDEREKWRKAWGVAMQVIDEYAGDPPKEAYEKLKRIRGKFDAL